MMSITILNIRVEDIDSRMGDSDRKRPWTVSFPGGSENVATLDEALRIGLTKVHGCECCKLCGRNLRKLERDLGQRECSDCSSCLYFLQEATP